MPRRYGVVSEVCLAWYFIVGCLSPLQPSFPLLIVHLHWSQHCGYFEVGSSFLTCY